MSIKQELKKKKNKIKNEFLLTFFDDKKNKEIKIINGFQLIKSYNKNREYWEVNLCKK